MSLEGAVFLPLATSHSLIESSMLPEARVLPSRAERYGHDILTGLLESLSQFEFLGPTEEKRLSAHTRNQTTRLMKLPSFRPTDVDLTSSRDT